MGNTWFIQFNEYNAINVYCRELAPGAVSLTGDRAQGDDNKHCRDYTMFTFVYQVVLYRKQSPAG